MQLFNKKLFLLLFVLSCTKASAVPILFDFESGDEFNPTLVESGLTMSFSSSLPLTSQLVTDSRSLPFAGIGSMRLTLAAAGDSATAARLDFSHLLSNVSLWAIDASVSFIDANFQISALSSTNAVLGTVVVTPGSVYELIQFSGIGSIAALSFSANNVNVAYWDNLSATVIPSSSVPEPGSLSLMLLILGVLSFTRLRR